jgi:glycerate kinase
MLVGPRRFVIAPDKFKGSLSASEAAAAIERGLRRVPGLVESVTSIAMADGGEGTVEVFLGAGARAETVTVHGPLGVPVPAVFAIARDGTAVIEMANASGLLLLSAAERNALTASTYGTGELLRAALDLGVRRIVLGIGGSATNDGGAGLLTALGVRFLDAAGEALPPGGAALARLATIDLRGLDARMGAVPIDVACDVDSVLCGPHGASRMFGPQKGASPADVATLDAALAHFADITQTAVGRDCRNVAGAGAAGGLGFGLIAYLGAAIRPGVDVVAEVRGLRAALAGADVCLTGEGRIDDQTLRGKTVHGVARCAREAGVPTIAFAGKIDAEVEPLLAESGVACAIPIVDSLMTFEEALRDAAPLLERAATRVGRLLAVGAPITRD